MKKNKIFKILLIMFLTVVMCGCAAIDSAKNDIKGQLTGNSFHCYFYDNNGNKFLTASGDKIGMNSNIIKEKNIDSSNGSKITAYSMSSVVTVNIDGKQLQSCGDTIIFEEDGLHPEKEFELTDISSKSSGDVLENVILSNLVNQYKNMFGKGQVVVIQSQLGVPICAYSADKVYWEVSEDLPKTTKLMLDGKALYIHRANFQIIDKDLL